MPLVFPAMPAEADPNPLLISAAAAPRTGILWAYDEDVHGTRGILHPARIPQIDPRWDCRDFGRKHMHMVACMQRPGSTAAR